MATIAALVIAPPTDMRDLVKEAVESVINQTRQPDELLIRIDASKHIIRAPQSRLVRSLWAETEDGPEGQLGEVGNMNALIERTDCEWLAFLHDDDLWHPNHLEAAEAFMTDEHDVIVSNFRAIGRPQSTFERYHEDFRDLLFTNWFPPAVVVVRREVFGKWIDGRAPLDEPGYDAQGCVSFDGQRHQLHSNSPWIDWTNWRRLVNDGARFVRTRRTTVDYRFLGANGSWTDEQRAAAAADSPVSNLVNLSRLVHG